jgi:tetratricopeptide (TPR) repeat protein
MTIAPIADASNDELLQSEEFGRLLRGLALSEQFHFYVAVCVTPRVADTLLDNLASKLPAERGAEVRFVRLDPYEKHEDFGKPLSIDEVTISALEPLVYSPEENRRHGVVHVLDISRATPEDEKAFRWLFGRMNERRNHITRALGGEFILLATPDIEQLFVEAAPDFWSIRSDTYLFYGEEFRMDGTQVKSRSLGHAPPQPPTASSLGNTPEMVTSTIWPLRPMPVGLRLSSEAARRQFQPFLDFVREHWSVSPPKGLFEPSGLFEPNRRHETVATLSKLLEAKERGSPLWLEQIGSAGNTRSQDLGPWPYLPEELAEGARLAGQDDIARRIYRTLLNDAQEDRQSIRNGRWLHLNTTFVRAFFSLVALETEQGDIDAARTLVVKIAETDGPKPALGQQLTWALWLQGLGLFYRCLNSTELALDYFKESIVALQALPSLGTTTPELLPEGLVLASESALALGQADFALEWAKAALDALSPRWGTTGISSATSSDETSRGALPAPARWSDKGRQPAIYLPLEARILLALARAHDAYGDVREALAALQRATKVGDILMSKPSFYPNAQGLACAAYNDLARLYDYIGDKRNAAYYRREARLIGLDTCGPGDGFD